MNEPSNAKIYRNIQVWGFLIVAAQFAVLATVEMSQAGSVVLTVFAGVAALFALSVASAYNADGYSRRVLGRVGLKVPEVGES